MRIDVYLPLLLSALLAALAPSVSRRLAPARAARNLAVAATAAAGATVWTLGLLAATLVDDTPLALARVPEPVPELIAAAAIAAIGVAGYRLRKVVRSHRVTRRALRKMCEAHGSGTELVVAASPVPQAFALPGTQGRILVTSGMLAQLDARERSVLLAHERAHLRHRHQRLRLLVDIAAAVNPLLVSVRDTVTFLLERWADEHAADTVGDRTGAARALARAALITQQGGAACALHFSRLAITRRVAALQSSPPSNTPNARLLTVLVLALALLPLLGAADATQDFLEFLTRVLPGS